MAPWSDVRRYRSDMSDPLEEEAEAESVVGSGLEFGPDLDRKPLLLLDVDGVINDLNAHLMLGLLGGEDPDAAAKLGIELVRSHGHTLAVPVYMPELIRELTSRAETWWCTTWRDRANDELAAHLSVEAFPVIDPDGSENEGRDWKARHVRPLVEAAQEAGRSVVWIEDFNGDLPDLEGVVFVDTGERGVLRWADLPLDVFD